MDRLKKAKYFTKLDIHWGYNNVRIKSGDEWKAAFVTNRGLFEPNVMFFGLANSPSTFSVLMNDIFKDLIVLGKVTIYLDDILIFTNDLEEHRTLVREVLKRLKKHDLFCKPEKCKFEQPKVEYLGVLVSENCIEMDPVKGLRNGQPLRTPQTYGSSVGLQTSTGALSKTLAQSANHWTALQARQSGNGERRSKLPSMSSNGDSLRVQFYNCMTQTVTLELKLTPPASQPVRFCLRRGRMANGTLSHFTPSQ